MGFFQELKEDLSMAVNELIPEEDEETLNPEETAEGGEQLEQTQAAAENGTVEVNEDLFRAAVDRLDENEDIFAKASEAPKEDAAFKEEETLAAVPEEETALADADDEKAVEAKEEKPVADAKQEEADGADSLIKELCDEIEQKTEETELEKEVEKVMTQQSETVLKGEAVDETAVITNGMKVTGDISSQGSMDVLGAVKGNIEILGKLNISGEVEGNSVAAEVFADSANITGEIHAAGSVKIGQSSVIIGNIFATSAVIAGAVKGDIDVQGPVVLDTSAIVMGNIKSKSVQINNGAVIEGMCSQCYADVNPAAFFQDLKK